MLALAVLVALAALAAPAGALAHVEAAPSSLRAGQETEVVLTVPNERDGRAMTELDVVAPATVELVAASGPLGWHTQTAEQQAVWRGSLPPQAIVSLSLRARATGDPGPVTLSAVQRFDDGAAAQWKIGLTVLPASTKPPGMQPGRAAVGAAAGLAVVGAAVLLLRRRRHRSLETDSDVTC